MNQITRPPKQATTAEIAEALKVLFNSLPFQRGTDPQTATLAYVEALRGVSVEALTEGVRKFLRGECEGVSTKFVPTPPELARIVRTVSFAAIPVPKEPAYQRKESDPDERARMRLKMPMWRYAMETGRVSELAEANKRGFEAMVALAQAWGLPIEEEIWKALQRPDAEEKWRRTQAAAWREIERNPPPGLRRRVA